MKPTVISRKSHKLESFPAMRMLVLQGIFCRLLVLFTYRSFQKKFSKSKISNCMFVQHFRWVPAEWNSCSKTCGRGKQRRKILCRQRISKTLDKKIKKSNCKSLPKPARTRRCNMKECPPVWRAGKWNKVGSVEHLRVLWLNNSS